MNWWRRLLNKAELERRLDAELRFHFERQIADNISAGMTPDEARRSASLKFGALEHVKEECRDARGTRWLENGVQDVRFSLRMLRRSPAFAIVAVLCLALGIGANTAIFSVTDALMLRALPVIHPEQLVLFGEGQSSGVTDDFPRRSQQLFSQPFYREIRSKNDAFSDVAAIESMSGDVHARFSGGSSEIEPVKLQLVSGNYFAMLGVQPAVGRVLTPEDDGKPNGSAVVVMRYGYWERRFARNPSVMGRSLSFNGSVFTVVGVAAPEFFGTEVGRAPDFWVPLAAQAEVQPWLGHPLGAWTQSLWLMARMKPGIDISGAQAYTNVKFQQWLHELAGPSPSADQVADMQKAHVKVTGAARGISRLRREFSRPLQILMVLVGLVLLIACANIANLLLARAGTRRREIAVRVALGAQQRRLMSQLLSESLVLSLAGGGLGLWGASGGGHLLLAMVSRGADPVPLQLGLNASVLLFTFGVSVFTGMIFGMMPAIRMSRVDMGSLKEGKGLPRQHSQGRMGSVLVMVQVALAFFLIIGAALFVATLEKLEQTNTGFEKDRVLLLQLDSDSTNIKGPALMNLYRRVETRVKGLPGVRAASFCMMTFDEGQWSSPVWPQGVARTEANAKSFGGNRIGDQYFETLGTPIIAGRNFRPQDTPKSQSVAVVNETFARELYPKGSTLGRHFSLGEHDDFEIVGIVRDAKYQSLREEPKGEFFVYNGQAENADGFNDLIVRAEGNPKALIGELRAAIRAEDADLGISGTMTLAEEVDRSLAEEKLLAKLAGFFGVLALLLAAIGLYGVIAYSVARRTNEIGIRMALGATPAAIVNGVLSESLMLVLLGVAIGLPAALACGKLVASQLYGVQSTDPSILGGAAALLLTTALAASFVPARRAALLDPLIALREE